MSQTLDEIIREQEIVRLKSLPIATVKTKDDEIVYVRSVDGDIVGYIVGHTLTRDARAAAFVEEREAPYRHHIMLWEEIYFA